MKFLASERRVRNGYFAAFSLLLLIYFFVWLSTIQMARRFKGIDHRYRVVWNLELLRSHVNSTELSAEDYLNFQKGYYDTLFSHEKAIDSLVSIVRTLTYRNQSVNADSLEKIIKGRFAFQKSLAQRARKERPEIQKWEKIRASQDSSIARFRNVISRMEMTERANYNREATSLFRVSSFFIIINVMGFVISILLGIYAFSIYEKENQAKRVYRAQLEEGIEKLRATNEEINELRRIEKFAVSGRISRTVAHEVRNPLTNINLACQQLTGEVKEESAFLLEMIERNSKRINDLITDLLNSTKFSELNLQKVYPHVILDEALNLALDRVELNHIKVVKDYDVPREVEMDPDKIKIGFLNLIINAVEAMEPGQGILELKILNRNNYCIISIKDNGVGMDKDSVSRIFEPFFTLKKAGNGLGLTNTQTIILNHKGKINVISSPGSGTNFYIELPYVIGSHSTYMHNNS